MTSSETFSQSQNQDVETIIADAVNGIAADIAALPDTAAGIRAVILGGGYGRGEGGATPEGKPYNDLDFFVIADSPRAADLFHLLSRKWKEALGIDVDFHLVTDRNELYRNAGTLMMQELFAGYRVIYGDPDIFADAPVIPLKRLPWREGARLLLNRGTGLLLARRKLADNIDPEFIRRNLYKAILGCGDALLIAKHCYRQHGLERAGEVRRLYPGSPLAALYEEALQYKYRPNPESPESFEGLKARLQETRRIFLESVAQFAEIICGRSFPTPLDAARGIAYAGSESPGDVLKNMLLSLRYLCRTPSLLRPLHEHPRVKLMGLLVKCMEMEPGDDEAVFLKLWTRFN